MVKDMTTGSPTKLLLSFAIPTMLGNVFQQFYNMVDSIIVGKYVGFQSLAAVGATGGMNFLIIGFIFGLTLGFSVITSHRFGAGDMKKLRKCVVMAGYLSFVFAAVVSVLSVTLARWMLETMGVPPDIIDESTAYIRIIFGGIIITVFYNLLSTTLRAMGDSKIPVYFLVIASGINIVLDLIFIIVFKWGVIGAAAATLIAQFISCALCVFYIWKKYPILHLQKEDFLIDRHTMWELVKMGVPTAFQNSITAIGVMVVQSFINTFGSMTVAGYTAATRVEQVVNQCGLSIGFAMATYTGQNMGAGKIDRIKKGLRSCLLLSFVINIIAGAGVMIFSRPLTKLFMSKEDLANPAVAEQVIASSRTMIFVVGCTFTILGVLFVYRNALSGLGNAAVPFWSGVVELGMRVGITFGLYKTVGYLGVCLAEPMAWVGAVVLLVSAYYIIMHRITVKSKLKEA